MTDLERYNRILTILSHPYHNEVSRVDDLAKVLAYPEVPTPTFCKCVGDLITAYVEVSICVQLSYTIRLSSVDYTTMYEKSRKCLASTLMHLISPTWESIWLISIHLNTFPS